MAKMSPILEINKLFRDKLVPEQTGMGRVILCTKFTGPQLIEALHSKLDEELVELKQIIGSDNNLYITQELDNLRKNIVKEAKDAQEVIDSLIALGELPENIQERQDIIDQVCEKFQITKDVVFEAQKLDREERGSFIEGRFVKKLQIPEGDERYQYFMKKYKQVDSYDDEINL